MSDVIAMLARLVFILIGHSLLVKVLGNPCSTGPLFNTSNKPHKQFA